MRPGIAFLVALAALAPCAMRVDAQTISLGYGEPEATLMVVGHTMHVSMLGEQGVLESTAPEVVALGPVDGRPPYERRLLEARGPGRATLRARIDGLVVDEIELEVRTPDEVWWGIGEIPEEPSPPVLALLENDDVRLWVTFVGGGEALYGFPPDLAWTVGGESFPVDSYGRAGFDHFGGTVARGVHTSSFVSSAWTLPGPQLEVVGADEVSVSFVTERLPHHLGLVRLVLTRGDGTVVQGGRLTTPVGFGSLSAQESPPGYFFRRDAGATTTFAFLVGGVEHQVEVAGHPFIVTEGIGGTSGGGCAVGPSSPRAPWLAGWFGLVLAGLVTRRRA